MKNVTKASKQHPSAHSKRILRERQFLKCRSNPRMAWAVEQ
jgi:hypothetical protein